RLEAVLAQRQGGVDAAVVELDALPDPVRAAAEDDDLPLRRRTGLVLARLVRRVEIGRVGLELGAAGVDGLVDRLAAAGADGVLGRVEQLREAHVGEALLLERLETLRRES